MEFTEVIKKRRSVRQFTQNEVEQDKIYQLINYARLCQSAKNRQPWKFMVLKEGEKDEVAKIMLDSLSGEEDKNVYANTVKSSAQIIIKANALIAVFKEDNKDWIFSDLLSIGAAIEHICLGCTDLGLGSVWIADVCFSAKEISKYLGYENLSLVSVIAIGYPDEFPNPRPRKSLGECIITNKICINE